MLLRPFKGKNVKFYTSPWILLGALVILLVTLVIFAVRNINREKEYMSNILLEKGATILRSFESGARTGMMRMMWGRDQTQTLLEEIVRQPGIFYIYITDLHGRILAASNRTRIGRRLVSDSSLVKLNPGQGEKWRLTKLPNGQRVFEVYRYFHPMHRWRKEICGSAGDIMCFAGGRRSNTPMGFGGPRYAPTNQLIFVGLDTTPFEAARKEDIKNTLIISSVILLLTFAGFLSLFWAQNYKIANRLLKDTSAFASEVVTYLPLGLIATDQDGRIEFVNGSAEAITGVRLNVARGKKPEILFPDLWQLVKEELQKGNTIVEREIECDFGDRKNVPISLSAKRIFNDEGNFVGDVLIIRDLGDVRKLQDEIRRSEKLASLGRLAAGIAHEIRNPLSSIKGYATYFMSKFQGQKEEIKAAEVMINEVDRLNRVITELLEFARPSELRVSLVDISEVVEHSLRLIQEDAKSKNISIKFIGSNSLPQVRIDPDRFSQVLLNLFLNAIEAMESGGTLSVGISSLNRVGVQVEVTDTGKGISRENISKIFDPYYTTKNTGAGLGLAIVYKIVEAHGGKIKVRSEEGKGTTFYVVVPLAA